MVLGLWLAAAAVSAQADAAGKLTVTGACLAELQRANSAGGSEEALRVCSALFQEAGCQVAWTELLDAPRGPPGYGRAPSVARLAEGCVHAYCRLPGMGRQQLCTGKTPAPTSTEFFAAWRSFQGEVLRHERAPTSVNERLVRDLELWAGFQPRPGTRSILQAVMRPDVPGVLALTLWSARGEELGAWVADVLPDEQTLRALRGAVPRPTGDSASPAPCVWLEASALLPPGTTEALLKAVGEVCPADVVLVRDA
jgi:hypothetical protein